jgi:iron complex transport system substrate-binding protein
LKRHRSVAAAILTLLILASSALSSGCLLSREVRDNRKAGFPMTIKDAAGRQVKLSAISKRIISMAPSNTEILFALGLGDRVVGVTSWDNFPPEATAKEKVGDAFNPNYEKIVGLKPDLVLAVGTAQSEIVKKLDGMGLPTFVLQAASLAAVYDEILLVGRVTGASAKADELVASMKAKEAAVAAKVGPLANDRRPRVFWLLDDSLWTVGPGSFVHDLLTKAGGRNVAASAAKPYLQFSMESLLKEDPDVIIIGALAPDIAAKAKKLIGWDMLTAVKKGRVFAVDGDLVSRPGPRVNDGLQTVARLLYPDLFK